MYDLDQSHRRVNAIITLTYSYWFGWLVLKDILNTACNIMSAAYKGMEVGRVEGLCGWVNTANRHS